VGGFWKRRPRRCRCSIERVPPGSRLPRFDEGLSIMTTIEQQAGSAAAPEHRVGPPPDRDEIVRVVRLYVQATGAHDPELFRQAFHPSAWIFFTWPDGHLFEGLILDEIEGWANEDVRVSDRVLSVIQAGDVATVLLGFDQSDGNSWVDVHSLLRLDGGWKIMNKTATHASRADWAGPSGSADRLRDRQSSGAAVPEDRIGPAPDRDEIIRVVHLYTDGMGAHDLALFQEAFHPTARISWTNAEGELGEALIAEGLDGWADWPTHVTGRIIAVIQAGDVATVVLGFDADTGPADSWLDIHSLLRVHGTWKIMNKTATHASRADWAGPTAVGAGEGGASA
jgi:phage head maturation protease